MLQRPCESHPSLGLGFHSCFPTGRAGSASMWAFQRQSRGLLPSPSIGVRRDGPRQRPWARVPAFARVGRFVGGAARTAAASPGNSLASRPSIPPHGRPTTRTGGAGPEGPAQAHILGARGAQSPVERSATDSPGAARRQRDEPQRRGNGDPAPAARPRARRDQRGGSRHPGGPALSRPGAGPRSTRVRFAVRFARRPCAGRVRVRAHKGRAATAG